MTIGRSSESALVIRDDYTSSHHARLCCAATPGRSRTSTPRTAPSSPASASAARRLSLGTPIKVGATTFELRA